MNWLFLLLVATAPVPALAVDSCNTLQSEFKSAIRSGQSPAIERAYDAIEADVECGFEIDEYRTPAIAAEIAVLFDAQQESAHQTALEFAVNHLYIAGRWQLAEKLADYFLAAGKQAEAKEWYENALNFSRSHPVNPIGDEERRKLTLKASGAWILASNDAEGRKPGRVIRATTANGSVSGILVIDRGARPVAIAMPINFVYAKTDFTPVGQAAADDLAVAIHEQGIKSLKLIGHADPRGDKKLNFVLSQRRAERLRAYLLAQLQKAGDTPNIQTEGLGAEQPFDISVLPVKPSDEEIYALDRRVEFLRLPE